jgi:L-idonate 5-dehydrogenase
MKAVVIHAPHDLRIEPAPPEELGPGDVRVRIGVGGICGSDLHYYHDGRVGTIELRQPMILGHEVSGTVEAVGGRVSGLAPGDRVAVSPSRPCGRCRYCQEGSQQHCLDMRFYGSAMRFPHVHGAFREVLVADAGQCHKVPATVSLAEAAIAEPLAVCLHAANRAGPLLGRRVLVTGAGPIGCLAVLAARRAGAAEVVATDLAPAPLAIAERLGADRVLDLKADADALAPYGRDKGTFDVLFEASGSEKALAGALAALRPGAVVVQIGLAGRFTLPLNTLVAKEIELRGTFRFHAEFALAVELLARRLVDVKPLVTATLPFERAREAFDLASDRTRSMKVQLAFA